ncbi:MAG: hypothetical protein SGPRY_010300 [Prymnesium sp.]
MAQANSSGAPNLDVRLTRSVSGSILDIDFIGGVTDGTVPAPISNQMTMMPVQYANSGAIIMSGRKLKILEHRVHKVELRTKENEEQEEELVVSNLRPFLLKACGMGREGNLKPRREESLLDCTLPLRAALLYENGLQVKQTSSSEPLLVGETDVVALQGAATFKLRITSLSSHRDKQRFRIQVPVAPQEMERLQSEPALCVVTDPMKSVTKLGRSAATPAPQLLPSGGGDLLAGAPESVKRKCREILESHSQALQNISETQHVIRSELQRYRIHSQTLAIRPSFGNLDYHTERCAMRV